MKRPWVRAVTADWSEKQAVGQGGDRFSVNASRASSATAESAESDSVPCVIRGPHVAGISCGTGVHLSASH